jgi:hypothetical protein
LVIGCLVISKLHVPLFNQLIEHARKPELPHGEMKWTKVSDSKLSAYKRVVDAFFEGHPKCLPLEFHSIVVPMAKVKDKLYNQGSREIGFNKEIYQLCVKCARLYPDRLFHIYPDERRGAAPAEDLRLILNRGMRKQGDRRDWPFRRVHFQNSKRHHTLQLVDVLIGALAFHLNGHADEFIASPAKLELSTHILKQAKISDVFRSTAISGIFTMWHRQLR